MEASEGFSPIVRPDARVLILGSLPGQKSLADQEYYAHPQNAFWPIMACLFGISGAYEQRCARLLDEKVALWDVLQASIRPGSLDADIQRKSATANDFRAFLAENTHIDRIAFNGKKAEQLFRAMVPRKLYEPIQLIGLPSTSPAYAAMPFEGKLSLWRAGLDILQSTK
jgi:hypoxanthine-DNA glycosylase